VPGGSFKRQEIKLEQSAFNVQKELKYSSLCTMHLPSTRVTIEEPEAGSIGSEERVDN
jgi:hypothetical protein